MHSMKPRARGESAADRKARISRGRSELFTSFAKVLAGWVGFWVAIGAVAHWGPPARIAMSPVPITPLTAYVNDFAELLQPATRERLAAALQQFEKETSTTI